MRFFKFLFVFLLFSLFLSSCSFKKSDSFDDYSSIQEKLINMNSYSADSSLTYISNKGESNYNIKQFVRKDGKYILQTIYPDSLKGHFILFDGNILWQYNPSIDSKISVGDKDKLERKEISLFSFIQNYTKSKDVSVETSSSDNNLYTILEAIIPSSNQYFASEKLWINNKSKLPEKLVIFDKDGRQRVVLSFSNFSYNPNLDDSIFNVDNIIKKEHN